MDLADSAQLDAALALNGEELKGSELKIEKANQPKPKAEKQQKGGRQSGGAKDFGKYLQTMVSYMYFRLKGQSCFLVSLHMMYFSECIKEADLKLYNVTFFG